MTESYTSEDVSKHNHEKDLWMVIHGNVFDLTKFLKEHPGGEEVLLSLAGQDGTQCFDDIGHSAEAVKLRDTFKIGQISDSGGSSAPLPQNTPTKEQPTVDDDDWEYQEPKYEKSPWLPVIVAAGVAIYALIFYYFFYS